jgi:hypothetical protein
MKTVKLSLAFALLAVAGSLAAQPVMGPNGNYYELVTTPVGWEAAKTAAEGMSLSGATGHLATLTTAEEDAFVAGFAAASDAWFGASDLAVEGTWEWVTGETWSYDNWNNGEPNGGTTENCGHYFVGVWWNDTICTIARNYVVEYEAADFTPQSNTFATAVTPAAAGSPEMTITCNGGLPLNQSGAAGTTFTVTELSVGDECTVGMSTDLESGYMAGSYTCAPSGVASTDGCTFTIEAGVTAWTTTVNAVAIPFDFYVTVDWDISPHADPGTGVGTEVVMSCLGETDTSTTMDVSPAATNPVVVMIADVDPVSTCTAMLQNYGSAVEVSPADCSKDITVNGGDQTCAFTATAFYEGIPTLSQYGMAIMALLMLGVGFIGFRRFI